MESPKICEAAGYLPAGFHGSQTRAVALTTGKATRLFHRPTGTMQVLSSTVCMELFYSHHLHNMPAVSKHSVTIKQSVPGNGLSGTPLIRCHKFLIQCDTRIARISNKNVPLYMVWCTYSAVTIRTTFSFLGHDDSKSPFGYQITSFKMTDEVSRNLGALGVMRHLQETENMSRARETFSE